MAKALEDNFHEGDAYENLQFYYHPDHLGSSSYITNLDGEVVQHIEYVPFGEVFIDLQKNIHISLHIVIQQIHHKNLLILMAIVLLF